MTQDEKRLRIAQVMHWPVDEASGLCHIPSMPGILVDPFRSLDACHQMEKVLADESSDRFGVYLKAVCEIVDIEGGYYISATAPQRCEAFLQVMDQPS